MLGNGSAFGGGGGSAIANYVNPGSASFASTFQTGSFSPTYGLLSPGQTAQMQANAMWANGIHNGAGITGGGAPPRLFADGGLGMPTDSNGGGGGGGSGIAPVSQAPQAPKYNPGARDVALRALATPPPPAAAPAPAATPPGASAPAAGSYAAEWDRLNTRPAGKRGR